LDPNGRPNISPDPHPLQPRPAPARPLRREELAGAIVGVIKQGGPWKADLVLADLGGGPVVVKDFAGKSPLTRWLGRIQIAREAGAYRWLAGAEGIPTFVGRIDEYALAIEWVDGEELSQASGARGRELELVDRLRAIVRGFHARGLVHNDLRGRENVLLTKSGDLRVVDFAGALRLRPGGVLHRLLGRPLGLADESAVLRWKERLAPESLTLQEREFLERYKRYRWLWPFNRKRRRQPAADDPAAR
jgi:serine/threonine protein kinase